jgi:hypothetical protein
MTQPDNTQSAAPASPLPGLGDIFRGIKAGRHWCFGDTEFADLNGSRFEEYRDYFAPLGITLQRDARGFYFATSDDEEGKGSQLVPAMVAFTIFWIEHLADSGADIFKSLFEAKHAVADLPHLSAINHRAALERANLHTLPGLKNVLGNLHRFGFIELDSGGGGFTVRRSFYRLLDVCRQAAEAAVIKAQEAAPLESAPEAPTSE